MSYSSIVGLRGYALAAILIWLNGCGLRPSGSEPKTYLLPWRDPNSGQYSLKSVDINTLSSPTRLSGDAAEIYYQNQIGEAGFSGSIAEAHVLKVGGLFVPTDVGSSIALAAYAQYEGLMNFDRALGVADDVSWPRRVGVEMNLVSADGVLDHDNAHYIGDYDITTLIPYSGDAVPLSLNQGVVAHEHFHEHFQAVVLNHLSHAVDKTVQFVEHIFYPVFYSADADGGIMPLNARAGLHTTPGYLNNIAMRAWNEGLADFYAYVFTDQPDFFFASQVNAASARDLRGDSGRLVTAKAQRDQGLDKLMDDVRFTDFAYKQGTSLARAFYEIAKYGTESRQKFLLRVMKNLAKIPARMNDTFATRIMALDEVVPVLIGDDYPHTTFTCSVLKGVTQEGTFNSKEFHACNRSL